MQVRTGFMVLVAVAAMSGSAQAAIKVNAKVGNATLACADAANVKLTPATARTDMRFTYECLTEGVARTCTPAAAGSADPLIEPGAPDLKYQAFAASGGPVITVTCDAQAAVVEKGTEFVGTIDGQALAGCHPAIAVESSAAIWRVSQKPVSQCNTGASSNGTHTANCIEFRCPNDAAARACYPVAEVTYASRLADSDAALRRVAMDCETVSPMLSHGFD